MNVNERIANSVDIDPYAPEFLRDPYPYYRELRERGEAVWLDKYGIWGMARYQEVHAAVSDWKSYLSGGGVGLNDIRRDPNPVLARRLTLEIDPPDHTKYRAILTRVLSPLTIKKLREEFAKQADTLVDQLLDLRRFDAAEHVARAYPLKVFPDAIGVQQNGRENLLKWSQLIFNSFGPQNEIFLASLPEGKKAFEWVMESCAREAIAPGGLAAMIYEASDRGEVTPDDAPFLVRPFLTAGIDTTISAIGGLLHALALYPEQWKMLRENPGMSRAAFEEAVRWQSPVQAFCRTTSRDVSVGKVVIPEGSKVVMFLGSANHDPARWQYPEKFEATRNTQGHLGFGGGIHACVGQMIARLEGELILNALLKRVSKIELAGEVTYELNNTMRQIATLPIEITAA